MSQHNHSHSRGPGSQKPLSSCTHIVPPGGCSSLSPQVQRGANWGSQRWRDIPTTHSRTVARSPRVSSGGGEVLTS